jgi:cytochrome c2
MSSAGQATLIGGSHDFTTLNGSAGYTTFKFGGATGTDATGAGTIAGNASFYINPCQVCHIPHKAPEGTKGPLWNHANSLNASYVTYDQGHSATFNALNLTVTLGSSVACLSCHDGSVAVNQSYGATLPNANGTTTGATAYYNPTFSIETATATAGNFVSASGAGPYLGRNDLTHMHPIGVSYVDALAKDPTLQPLPVAGTVFAQMLKGPNKTVECASCHDIHNVMGVSASQSHSIIVDLNYGKLCETCHQQ